MRRVSTLFEIVLSATLLILGLYVLQEGIANKSSSSVAMLILGAICFTLGVTTLVSAARSILWHRHMLRHSVPMYPVEGHPREYIHRR
jgi:predicted membrane channel-forming protein YqfA (hemolysin III family)